jgi:hypothetical protein
MADIQTLVGRALSDDSFAQSLLNNPESVLRANGIEPTDEMVEALNEIDVEGLRMLAAAFGEEGKAA